MGFSRTKGLLGCCLEAILGEALDDAFEACRMVRAVEEGVESRVRHIVPLWGRRKRGIEVVGGISDGWLME